MFALTNKNDKQETYLAESLDSTALNQYKVKSNVWARLRGLEVLGT
jgi:hypothetical protein